MKKFVKNVGLMIIFSALWIGITDVAAKIMYWFEDYRTNKEIEKVKKELEEADDAS